MPRECPRTWTPEVGFHCCREELCEWWIDGRGCATRITVEDQVRIHDHIVKRDNEGNAYNGTRRRQLVRGALLDNWFPPAKVDDAMRMLDELAAGEEEPE